MTWAVALLIFNPITDPAALDAFTVYSDSRFSTSVECAAAIPAETAAFKRINPSWEIKEVSCDER